MAEYIVKVNQDNTIDIPSEVREKLILEPGDKMIMRFDNAGEHVTMGKLPMDAIEKGTELHRDNIGHTVQIKK